jgi:hypothetical protein
MIEDRHNIAQILLAVAGLFALIAMIFVMTDSLIVGIVFLVFEQQLPRLAAHFSPIHAAIPI